MKPEPFELQHDDHIWITINGESWAIHRMDWPYLWVWRGYEPNIEHLFVEMNDFCAEEYCDKAVQLLRELYS